MPISEDEKLGQRLQFYREQIGLTQQEMADYCDLSKNYISAIERGVNKCNAKTFITYGKVCGISLDVLADFPNSEPILIELRDRISQMTLEQQNRLLEFLKIVQ